MTMETMIPSVLHLPTILSQLMIGTSAMTQITQMTKIAQTTQINQIPHGYGFGPRLRIRACTIRGSYRDGVTACGTSQGWRRGGFWKGPGMRTRTTVHSLD